MKSIGAPGGKEGISMEIEAFAVSHIIVVTSLLNNS